MTHMFRTFLVVLLGLISAQGNAQSQSHGPSGPFTDSNELLQAWYQYSFNGTQTNWLYLDGNLISSGVGFGPAITGRYLTCPDTQIYKNACPTIAAPTAIGCDCNGYPTWGRCNLFGTSDPLVGATNFDWSGYGSATLVPTPYGSSATYYAPPGGTGGAVVVVSYSDGTVLSASCAIRQY